MKVTVNLLAWVAILGLAGCGATMDGSDSSDVSGGAAIAPEATACLEGDSVVSSSAQCLQDDAACYPIADGNWCTGPRAISCPMGSNPLPAELPCPEGARCFAQSESLQCVIGG